LIDENDGQIGILDIREALNRAKAAEMDLVEVAPQARPPVCRIMDYGKFVYAQRKKEQKAKAHRHETALKEIRIKTPKIDNHDLSIKVNHAKGFLSRGDRVQFSLRFRGRELAHIDEGHRIFARIREELVEVAKVDQAPRYEGKRLTMTLAPGVGKPAAPASGKPPAPKPPAAPTAPNVEAPTAETPKVEAPKADVAVPQAPQ
jgi:translation initiation factor IF-3